MRCSRLAGNAVRSGGMAQHSRQRWRAIAGSETRCGKTSAAKNGGVGMRGARQQRAAWQKRRARRGEAKTRMAWRQWRNEKISAARNENS